MSRAKQVILDCTELLVRLISIVPEKASGHLPI